jgi:dTDP-4-amino-4,6-dideoxygalactose transaminase
MESDARWGQEAPGMKAPPISRPGEHRGPVLFVDLGSQHDELKDDLSAAFLRVLEQGSFTLGGEVDALEAEFAAFVGTREAIGVGSGTDALHLALRAAGIGLGDEVITAVNSFAATAEAIVFAGATPVFVDVDDSTLLMDLDATAAAVTDRTRAIIPVHLYGQCVDMHRVLDIASPRGIRVIEDACQAHGASRLGLQAGAAGDAGCFSFYPSKNLGALGDGGIVTTDDEEIARRVRRLRSHGEDANRAHVDVGLTSRLHGLQAAFLRAKLPQLAVWNQQRRVAASRYEEMLGGNGVVLPTVAPDSEHVFHLYCVRVPDRDGVRRSLSQRGVQTGIHYQTPLHLEPAFAFLGRSPGDFPVAEKAAREIVSLPMHPHLTEADIELVASALGEVLGHA